MLPMNLMFIYNVLTLLLFIFGAWNYKVTNYPSVIIVVLSNLFALYLGYLVVINRHKSQVIDEYTYNNL